MTIKSNCLSIKKYVTINGISVPGIYITFPSYFKKVTHIEPKTIIGYSFNNNVLKLTIESEIKHNTTRINKGNSIFISRQKCEELNMLNIPEHTIHANFVIRNETLVLDLSKFKSEVKNFSDAKPKKALPKASFKYYTEEELQDFDKKQIKMNLK